MVCRRLRFVRSAEPKSQPDGRALLKAAGEDFALLHEGEKTAGNDVRRVGEEGLYEELARHNIEQMTGAKPFKRIITTDPHSYNTIRMNIRPSVRLRTIAHYSTLLADLLLPAGSK